jgi:hypothetical protein
MWEPRRLTTVWASTVCYRNSVTFYTLSASLDVLETSNCEPCFNSFVGPCTPAARLSHVQATWSSPQHELQVIVTHGKNTRLYNRKRCYGDQGCKLFCFSVCMIISKFSWVLYSYISCVVGCIAWTLRRSVLNELERTGRMEVLRKTANNGVPTQISAEASRIAV